MIVTNRYLVFSFMNKLNRVLVISSAMFGIFGTNNGYSNPNDKLEIRSSNDNKMLEIKHEERINIDNKQINTVLNSLHVVVNVWCDDLQNKLDNIVQHSSEFINDISYNIEYKEVNYINILSKLKEANEQFIDDLNEFKYDINEYNESIKRKLNNIYKNNKSNSKIGKLIEGVVLEIANKFEEYAATFDYLLNNKQNINNLRKQSMNKFTSELIDKFGDYASNLLNNIQTDLSSKDESYGDKLNSILQYASKPYFIANGNIQYVIKEGNKFINKMVETNNKIQEQFVKKDLVNKLQTVAIS